MKQFIAIFLLLTGLCNMSMAQESITDTTVYRVVEKWPEYPEGINKLMKDIRTSTDNYWKRKYPKGKPIVIEDGISRVIVSFVINENGQVTDPEVLRRVDKDLDKEAIRIIKSMPRWIPGEHKGKKVKVRFTLPVMF